MQLRHEYTNTGEDYVAQKAWEKATLKACPLHPRGGCGLARHGTYGRRTPKGVRIPRYYCPEGKTTFSLLPDFLAARLPGELAAVEEVVRAADEIATHEAAADRLRPDIELPGAVRWLRRRRRRVRVALLAVVTLVPELFGTDPHLRAVGERLGTESVLTTLRGMAAAYLPSLTSPLGFCSPNASAGSSSGRFQHKEGPDGTG